MSVSIYVDGTGGNYVGNGKPGNQRIPTAGYDGVDAKRPSGYTKNLTDDVNNPSVVPLRRVTEQYVCKQVTIPAGGVTYTTKTDGNVATTVTHPIVFTRPDGSSYDTIVTDENGEATTGWLPIDETGEVTYYVVEVKTSNGRVLGNPTLDPSVPNSGIKAYTLKYDGTLKNAGATLVDRQVEHVQVLQEDEEERDTRGRRPRRGRDSRILEAGRRHRPEPELDRRDADAREERQPVRPVHI